MSCCPVCYQDYVVGPGGGDLAPRKLPCGDTSCTGCVRDALVDNQLVCQVCMKGFTFANAGDVPLWGGQVENEADVSDTESICSDMSDMSFASSVEGDTDSDTGSDRSSRASMSPTSASKLLEFMSSVPSGAGAARLLKRSSSDGGEGRKQTKSCAIDGCPNRRGPRGYCSMHGPGSHFSTESAKRATHKLERAKLSRLTFKPGDRLVKEMTESEASPWTRIDPDELASRFKSHKLMELGEALELIDQSRDILRKEHNILNLSGPLIAVGDIHGQFFDLLHLLEEGGLPGDTTYLFLGDYVDRGKFSCEVMLYLLALKVKYPDRIYLIRGNHESRGTTGYFGFKEECKQKYGLVVYYRFILCFECLPLCAIVQTSYGRMFACHGGISPDIRTLDEIEGIDRFTEPDCKGALCDILWSDPLHENVGGPMDCSDFLSVEWKPNAERGCSYYFGFRAIRRFLDENDLLCLVRAHQVQEEGFKRHFYALDQALPGSPLTNVNVRHLLPPVITVFSAPNYCDRYGNRAAFLRIGLEPNELSFEQFDCVPKNVQQHPALADGEAAAAHHLAFLKICPYMPTTVRDLFRVAMELGTAEPPPSPTAAGDEPLSPMTTPPQVHYPASPPLRHQPPLETPSPQRTAEEGPKAPGDADGHKFSFGRTKTPCQTATASPPLTPTRDSAWHRGGGGLSSLRAASGRPGSGGAASVSSPLSSPSRPLKPVSSLARLVDAPPPPQSSKKYHWTDSGNNKAASSMHQRVPVIRRQHASGGDDKAGAVGRSSVSPAIKTRQNLYLFAVARDGINEMHPEILEKRMQVIADDLRSRGDRGAEGETGGTATRGMENDAENIKGRKFSVRELCLRFEEGMLEKVEGTVDAGGQSSETGSPHKRHVSLDQLKLTANSVAELRRFFEVFSTQHLDRRLRSSGGKDAGRRVSGEGAKDGQQQQGWKSRSRSPSPTRGLFSMFGRKRPLPSPSSPPPEGAEVVVPGTDGAGAGGDGVSRRPMAPPVQPEVFTHDEIVTLRLIFSLFDDNGDDFIDRQELMRYAEETGDYALDHQATECIKVLDVDGDGRIGLWDYINLAARLKELHRANQHAAMLCELKERVASNKLKDITV